MRVDSALPWCKPTSAPGTWEASPPTWSARSAANSASAGLLRHLRWTVREPTAATRRLAVIIPAVLLLIAGLLYAGFGVLRHALVVMLNVPFALVGSIGALWLRGLHLNLSAAVRMIAVFGVAILNGLVLIANVNQLRAVGLSLAESIRDGALIRLRPVLATATVASVGFLPMAISTSAGAEVQRPLATVVIGVWYRLPC